MQDDKEFVEDLQVDLIQELIKINRRDKNNITVLEAVVLPYQNSYIIYLDNLERAVKSNITDLAVSINDVDITDRRELVYRIVNKIEDYPKLFHPLLMDTPYSDTHLSDTQKKWEFGILTYEQINSLLQEKRLKLIAPLSTILYLGMKTPKWLRRLNASLMDNFPITGIKALHTKYKNLSDKISFEHVNITSMGRRLFRRDYDLVRTIQDINRKVDLFLFSALNNPRGEFPESHYKAALTFLILDLADNNFTPQEKEYYIRILEEFRYLHKKFFPVFNEVEKQHYKKH